MVVFTRSWDKVYVEQKLVASHIRSHTYGYTTVREHLASNSRVIMERSAAYYVEKAKDISPDCHEYVKSIFDPKRTAQPEEVKRNGLNASADETIIFHAPTPSNHGNMLGKDYFTGNDMNK